jgi:MerR family redox-sensitive transcriptional activator SoxR
MTIGALARKARVRASTIRYYERCGLLAAPLRVSGQRRYDELAVQRLAIIRFARYLGFSLGDIGRLLEGTRVRPPSVRWRHMAHERMRSLDDTIRQASALKQMLQETLSEQCPRLVERATILINK